MTIIRNSQDFIELEIDVGLYSFDVLHKCFYWYCRDFVVEIIDEKNNRARIKLTPKARGIDQLDQKKIINRIYNDLIDHKTRDIVSKETKNVRDLLIAKAFAHSDEFDQAPPGNYHI